MGGDDEHGKSEGFGGFIYKGSTPLCVWWSALGDLVRCQSGKPVRWWWWLCCTQPKYLSSLGAEGLSSSVLNNKGPRLVGI